MKDIVWATPLTIMVFFAMRQVSARLGNHPAVNPLLLTMLVIMAALAVAHMPFDRYYVGNWPVHGMMQPAVVALAYPLYKQLPQIVRRWKAVLGGCLIGCATALISGAGLAFLLGGTRAIAASVLPKSATTPIALAVAHSVDGIVAITSACVVLVGVFGAVCGQSILNAARIRNHAARGLAMGACSHVLGTARAAESHPEEGAFSSLSLVLCGVMTAIMGPPVFHAVIVLMARFQ